MSETFSPKPWNLWVLILPVVLLALSGCDYARMYDDEAVDVYKMALPDMPSTSLPFGETDPLEAAEPESLENPLPPSEAVVAEGKIRYGYYCAHCHGINGRGYGTVGQSFGPLPTNLTGGYVQDQYDGILFQRITKGFLRHPPMGYTVTAEDRWAIIRFIRTLSRAESVRSPDYRDHSSTYHPEAETLHEMGYRRIDPIKERKSDADRSR